MSDEPFLIKLVAVTPDYVQRVEKMLRAKPKAEPFFEKPLAVVAPTIDQPITEKLGTYIDRYKLVHEIGQGGMGVVYMAVQKEPVRRKVALKIIKPGMDTREVVARFEAERQALALMDHQSIADVLDGGSTPSGRPYFVMELVDGTPITEYCDAARFTTRQRLELFIQVCQAVQHAHLKGVIHRDIKPSNILVTHFDAAPVPKVIDFGIAKAVNQQLTDQSLYTQHRADDRHAALHVAGAGRADRPGRGHPNGCVFAGCVAVRATDRHHAVRQGATEELGPGRSQADHPRGGAAAAQHTTEHAGRGPRHGRREASHRSSHAIP